MLAKFPIVAFVATSDAKRAKAFYSGVLGLPLISEDEFAVVFDAHGTMLRVAIVGEVVLAPYTVLGWDVEDIAMTVRGLAVVMLLLAKLMVDTGRPHLGESCFVVVIQAWAYLFIVMGIWFTITPWKLRDILNWATATECRTRFFSGVRLAFAVFVLILGLTAFRAM